jgi:hypothetical protein
MEQTNNAEKINLLLFELDVNQGLRGYFNHSIFHLFRVDYSKIELKKVNKNIKIILKKLKSLGIEFYLDFQEARKNYLKTKIEIEKEIAKRTYNLIEVLTE